VDVILDTQPNLAPTFQGGMPTRILVEATLIRAAELGKIDQYVRGYRPVSCFTLLNSRYRP
jgi:hypothetical protein